MFLSSMHPWKISCRRISCGALPCQRHLFDIPDSVCFLNAAYISPQLKASANAGVDGARRKSSPWEVVADDFYTDCKLLRSLFAQLISADSRDVALVPSASYGAATAARNLLPELVCGQNIVTLAGEHTSNRFIWQSATMDDTRGYSLRIVPPPSLIPEGMTWTEMVLAHIDENTGIVAIVPSFWTNGALLDLVRISERCKEVGAAVVVDGTQSIGAVPFDVRQVDPDFLICAGYKWLLCPYGVSFLYAARHRYEAATGPQSLEEHGWADRASGKGRAMWGMPGGESSDGLLDMQPTLEARRFDAGEMGNWATLPAAVAALKQLNDWTPAGIACTLALLTSAIAEEAVGRGWSVVPAIQRLPHMIGVEPLRQKQGKQKKWAGDLAQRLWHRHGVHVSIRGSALRVSPHVYNNSKDIEQLFSALDAEPLWEE